MGRVKFGSGVQQILGTVGGVTFSQVATTPTARGWRRPVNKRTAAQRSRRQPFATFSSEWFATLTQTERDNWDAYADTVTFTNLLGDTYKISGFQMWMRTALNVSQTPNPVLTTAPTIPGLPTARTLTVQLIHATGVLSVQAITPAGLAADRLSFIHRPFDRVTRTLPRGRRDGETDLPGNQATPFTIDTYGALPLSAGDMQGFSNFFYYDSDNRLTIPAIQSAVSQ